MKAEYINPFILATKSVFDTMVECPLERGQPYMKKGEHPEHDISAVIGYAGRAKGCVVISLSLDMALHAASVMLDEPCTEASPDVLDTVGELTNMVAGSAKLHLEKLELRISLPMMISGKDHRIEFPDGVTPMCIPFSCEWGEVLVEYALVEIEALVS